MFSRSKPTDPVPQPSPPPVPDVDSGWPGSSGTQVPATRKAAPSVLSSDLTIKGNVTSTGDIQLEGTIEGDIRAAHLTVGETATVQGEVVADEVVVNGRVSGRLRGLRVRLTASARVEGDIIHKTIAIESGAHFEGSVQRQDDPVGSQSTARLSAPRELFRETRNETAAVEAAE